MKQFLYNLFGRKFNSLKHSDKYKHAIFGTLIYLGIWAFFSSLIALIVVLIIGALVEIYDYLSKKGTPEFFDFLATVAIPIILYLIWQI